MTTTSSPRTCSGVATSCTKRLSFVDGVGGGGFDADDDGSKSSTLTSLSRGSHSVSVMIPPHPRAMRSSDKDDEASSTGVRWARWCRSRRFWWLRWR